MPRLPAPLVFALLAGLVLGAGGCGMLGGGPTAVMPADELYQTGQMELDRRRYEEARENFRKIVERHPNSGEAPRARFLIGEAYYREAEFDKAIKEFEGFLAFFPRHQIADLVQYRLAMAYYDQLKPIEQDQSLTAKALEQFRRLVKDYPGSRYAADALAKVDVCRGRLAQKEVWIASYYLKQGNTRGARQRLELVLREYPRTLVVPEAMWLLAEVNIREGKVEAADELLRDLAANYGYMDLGRRAAQRLRAAR